jgi:hypothetical protein
LPRIEEAENGAASRNSAASSGTLRDSRRRSLAARAAPLERRHDVLDALERALFGPPLVNLPQREAFAECVERVLERQHAVEQRVEARPHLVLPALELAFALAIGLRGRRQGRALSRARARRLLRRRLVWLAG